jgi:hypothetical protein
MDPLVPTMMSFKHIQGTAPAQLTTLSAYESWRGAPMSARASTAEPRAVALLRE